MSLIENTFLSARVRKNLSKNGFISWRNTEIFAEQIIEEFDVRTPGANNVARSLSGGNLQKFVIGREILQMPDVLIVNQPTWGVDAAAAAAIRQSIMDLATNGAGIIVISQDLDELLEISDNFSALNSGKMSLPKPTKDLSIDEIGLMMAGNTNDAHSVFDHHNMVNNNAHS
jgi:simple sugar transport system ATP-binding protein